MMRVCRFGIVPIQYQLIRSIDFTVFNAHLNNYTDAPHDLICHGQVLALKNGNNPDNIALFSKFHQKGNAVVVYGGRDQINSTLWAPESFSKHFGWFFIV